MNNGKWLALSLCTGLFFGLGLAACDDEEGVACESDEDCLDTEICDLECDGGICITPCTGDAECGEGEFCAPAADGCDMRCLDESGAGGSGGGGGEGGTGGGEPTCDEQADCYPDSYCASTNECVSLDVFAGCSTANAAPAMETNGPALIAVNQVDLDAGSGSFCTKEPATCTNNGNVCSFRIDFYDPNGDVPGTKGPLYGQTRFIPSGSTAAVDSYDIRDISVSGNFGSFNVLGCYDENNATPNGVVYVIDNGGNNSNPVCLSGVAP